MIPDYWKWPESRPVIPVILGVNSPLQIVEVQNARQFSPCRSCNLQLYASRNLCHRKLIIIQDICLTVALTILLGRFFSTYIFQVGLIQLLYSRFRLTLVLCVTYLVLSITLHSWHMTRQWTPQLPFQPWNKGFHALYAIHRVVAVIYYYFYKRAALRISDPRLYEGSSWVQKQLSLP